MTPWAEREFAERNRRDRVDDPYGYCMPPGVPRIDVLQHPFKIVQTPRLVAMLHETAVNPTFRQVFVDGRPLPVAPEPTWLGYSIGRWEGNTLVVDTTGFKDGGWLDRGGHPHSDALAVVERFRRINIGSMELSVTITDPKAYVRPRTVKIALHLLPDTDLLESSCESHERTTAHRVLPPAP